MAEEHRFQAPRLCANNCGFFGSPTTQDLCSKCFRDLQIQQRNSSSAKEALTQTLASSSSSSSAVAASPPPSILAVEDNRSKPETVAQPQPQPPQDPSRCSSCRRRVGLTGFKCRCGFVYCGNHRYPEQHHCSFDFKSLGKDQIAKANPVVKAEKLEKI